MMCSRCVYTKLEWKVKVCFDIRTVIKLSWVSIEFGNRGENMVPQGSLLSLPKTILHVGFHLEHH